MKTYAIYINGQWANGVENRTICSPYDGKPFAQVQWAGEEQVELALQSANKASEIGRSAKRPVSPCLLLA